MIHALTSEDVRRAEQRAVDGGTSLAELMRRAGDAVAEEVERRSSDGRVAVVAGKGNNGGDGWVAARELESRGREVHVVALAAPSELAEPAAGAARDAIAAGVPWTTATDATDVARELAHAGIAVDAVFGVGLSGPPAPSYASSIDAVNAAGVPVVSVDVPSGVDADAGRVPGAAVRADVTVTFGSPKVGLLLYPGAELAGEVVSFDIGVPEEPSRGALEVWDEEDYRPLLPRFRPDIHKNERGRVLVVAGSRSYPGAAVLAVMGAQRMGAGYVTLAVPDSVLPVVQTKLTSAVAVGLTENPSRTFASKVADTVLDIARDHDAVVLGPGLTVAHGAVLVVRRLVRELDVPLVIDADGLNALVDAVDLITDRAAPTVVTPHPGELARLLNVGVSDVQSDRVSYGARFSGPSLTCVLKGARTIVSGAGRRVVTLSGDAGLAAAGTGDVLAGAIGTLLAQGLEPYEAGALAAYLHGRAGQLAARELTQHGVIAEDVPGFLPGAVRELLER